LHRGLALIAVLAILKLRAWSPLPFLLELVPALVLAGL